MTTIINVVSGKGGTGKTLVAASLAEMLSSQGKNILLIDLDFFVRGLTSLLFNFTRKAELVQRSESSVADFFLKRAKSRKSNRKVRLGVKRYRAYDVLPAVSRINSMLPYDDILPQSLSEALSDLRLLLKSIPGNYDLILLDSRAGYDRFILAASLVSDVSLVVEEDDPISRVTADNLIQQLGVQRSLKRERIIFRLTNKARRGVSNQDVGEVESGDIGHLGVIPFDIEVLNNFGEPNFWERLTKTLFWSGLGKAWNRLNRLMSLNMEIATFRVSPIGSERLERRIGIFSISERVLLVYGIIFSLIGFTVPFIGFENIYDILFRDPRNLIFLLFGLTGMMMVIQAVFSLSRRD